jgi:ribosome biogenesis GTPase / thiamine phosphate phosphatase
MKSTGSWYQVWSEEGQMIECRMRGKFRMKGLNLTNPIGVGDWVYYTLEAEKGKGTIVEILPRENYVIRQSPRQKHHHHLIASNVDQAMVIVTLKEPDLKVGFIDRFLLTTDPQDIPAIIVFNKSDLYNEEDRELYNALEYTYQKIGYEVLLVSSFSKEGLEALRGKLRDKVTLISGQSGVGKSSLVNALQPQLELRTFEISDHSGKGQHTTTFAEMHPLDFGGYLIDTPGIKTLSFLNMTVQDVAHNFKEFFAMSPQCRFRGNCTHRNEPGCAIKAAVEDLKISPIRYQNYLSILEEIEEKNYWEIQD